MAKKTKEQEYGQYLAHRMANHKPLTKYQMARKWKKLGSVYNVELGIRWIHANTPASKNPFLFYWDGGEPKWGFRYSFGEVSVNLTWNLGYIRTRMKTTQDVIDHSIASPVVTMTPKEKAAAVAISAQAGGTIAFIDSMLASL